MSTPRKSSSACSYMFTLVRFTARIKSTASTLRATPVESSGILFS